nr:hypothetical protein GCM10025699_73680 [Microbacterium flavescens]
MVTASQTVALARTLPDVAAHADDIAADFYDRLFAARPDLLRDRFNRGEHAQGRQARELARTVVALAEAVIDAAPGSGTSTSARAAATLHPSPTRPALPRWPGRPRPRSPRAWPSATRRWASVEATTTCSWVICGRRPAPPWRTASTRRRTTPGRRCTAR